MFSTKGAFNVLIALLFCGPMVFANSGNDIRANKGTIDLSNWNFNVDGNIKLDGEWEFYWQRFIGFDTIGLNDTKPNYILVPGLWNKFYKDTVNESSKGYASYRLKILLNTNEQLAIKFINAASACEIFIDGQSYFKSGQPGKSKATTQPSYKPGIIRFTPSRNQVEIIMHIANYHHKKNGPWESLLIGTEHNIEQYHNWKLFIELVLTGCIFIMSLFHYIMFISHKSDKASLYFALFTFFISIRLIVTGEFTIYMLGDFYWPLLVKADYLSFYLGILFFFFFIKALYPKEVHKIPTYSIIIASLIFSLSAIIFPPEFITYNILYFQFFSIIAGIYALSIIYKAIKRKRKWAILFLYGFVALFITLLHDILKENGIINSIPLASFGLTIFIMFQATTLSARVRQALINNEKLSVELKTSNKELKRAKNKAEESDRFKSGFLANMSHEIRTPMNGIIGFSDLLKQEEFSAEEKKEFIEIINERSHLLLGIVNDIIDITKIETGQIDVTITQTCINSMLDELYLNYSHSSAKGVSVIKNTTYRQDYLKINTDNLKLRQILNNLISNAIKFTKKGSVEFGYQLKDNEIVFFVIDTGIGLTKEEQERIFDRFNQANEKISQTYGGTGLGLAIAKAYIEKLGGRIWVESKKGKGSTFSFNIPYSPVLNN